MSLILDKTYGEQLRALRLRRGYVSMRKFCLIIGQDCGNWSKLETGKLAPPTSADRVKDQTLPLSPSIFELNWLIVAAFNYHECRIKSRLKKKFGIPEEMEV